jgi:hypothetical protein
MLYKKFKTRLDVPDDTVETIVRFSINQNLGNGDMENFFNNISASLFYALPVLKSEDSGSFLENKTLHYGLISLKYKIPIRIPLELYTINPIWKNVKKYTEEKTNQAPTYLISPSQQEKIPERDKTITTRFPTTMSGTFFLRRKTRKETHEKKIRNCFFLSENKEDERGRITEIQKGIFLLFSLPFSLQNPNSPPISSHKSTHREIYILKKERKIKEKKKQTT